MKKIQFKYMRSGLMIGLVFAANIIIWTVKLNQASLNSDVYITSVIGSTTLISFMLVFLLATRNRVIVKLFGGLDVVYFWHRFLAIFSIVLIFLHQSSAEDDGVIVLARYRVFDVEHDDLGELSRNLFIGLVGIALLAKMFKYEHFKMIHRLMIIPYVIGLFHGFALSWVDLLGFDYVSVWMVGTSLVGIGSYVYMLLLYKHLAFLNQGEIIEKNILNDSVVELKIKMKRMIRHQPGQFVFIQIKGHRSFNEIHPFSISGSDENHLYLTIKVLGDYTKKVYSKLKTPTKIKVSHAYGHMIFDDKKHEHIWLAGGIGVTPFLGRLRSLKALDQKVHLYYSVGNEKEAVYKDFFEAYQKDHPNFKFTLHDTSKSGYIGYEHLKIVNDAHVYMCGPKPMVDGLNKAFYEEAHEGDVTFEAFNFTGSLLQNVSLYLKKIYQAYKKGQ